MQTPQKNEQDGQIIQLLKADLIAFLVATAIQAHHTKRSDMI